VVSNRPGEHFRADGPLTIDRGKGNAVRLDYPIDVTLGKASLLIINELPFEEYVAAVVAGEASGFKSDESLKAMAVAARSYAAHFLNQHEAEGFNFCDTTHCQDFRITAVTPRLRKAVDDTRGEVLIYDDQPIAAYYHQDCGGITEGRSAYLPQLRDRFCLARGESRWTTRLTARDLRLVFGIDNVSTIEIVNRTGSGRAERLRIVGSASQTMTAENFRLTVGRKLGWDKIKSDLYEIRQSGDSLTFEGRGSGHGIGMCQNGAATMGEQGSSYKDILAYYYPNTRLATVAVR
jgi:stage II sporulation protein D